MIEIVSFTLDNLLLPSGDPVEVGITETLSTDKKISHEKINSSIIKATESEKYDIVVAPEYSFLPNNGPMKKSELENYVDKFKQICGDTLVIPGTFVWTQNGKMYNTCYAFYQGQIVHQHDKIVDGGDDFLAKKHDLYWKKDNLISQFNWQGLNVGIEICAEVGILAEEKIDNLDLVIPVSAGEFDLKWSMDSVHDNGYGIVSDGFTNFHFAGDHAQVAIECERVEEYHLETIKKLIGI